MGLVLSLVAPISSARAQESEPGDSCAGVATGAFRQSAGDGTIGHILICDGTNWQPLLSHNNDGEATAIGNQTCGNGDVLTYNSTIWTCGAGGGGSSLWEEVGGVLRPTSANPRVSLNHNATVSGDEAVAWGMATASGSFGSAWGEITTASGNNSTAWGQESLASGDLSTIWGRDGTANGELSTAWGDGTHAGSYLETSIGQYPLNTAGTAGSWVATETLFEIGNGANSGARANAVTVLKNGNVGIGTTDPGVALDVDGDIEYTGVIADVSDSRLKNKIKALSAASASSVGQLKPVSFEMKDREGVRELGFIAQDVEQLFPELVQESDAGVKSLNYVGLIAPMVKAIQQLQDENVALRARIEALESGKGAPAQPESIKD